MGYPPGKCHDLSSTYQHQEVGTYILNTTQLCWYVPFPTRVGVNVLDSTVPTCVYFYMYIILLSQWSHANM